MDSQNDHCMLRFKAMLLKCYSIGYTRNYSYNTIYYVINILYFNQLQLFRLVKWSVVSCIFNKVKEQRLAHVLYSLGLGKVELRQSVQTCCTFVVVIWHFLMLFLGNQIKFRDMLYIQAKYIIK